MSDSVACFSYHSWLDEEEAGSQREKERVYPQEDLAAAQPGTQAQLSKTTDTNRRHILMLLECTTCFPPLRRTPGSRRSSAHTRSMPSSEPTDRVG